MRSKRIGRSLILAGVAMWIPYLLLKATGHDPNFAPFLAFHLLGVIPGSLLSRWGTLKKLVRRGR